jgi:predicted ArsR family transcriptional regulator
MKKSFVLVSLNENKAKKIAEVISNNTCRKILDYMAARKDVTEADLAKDLGIPISTAHYNMQSLMEAKLVKSNEFHYSVKGKEVNHYRLANQYVIIAPEGEKEAIREKLKSIIPTALIMGAAAVVIKLFSGFYTVKASTVMAEAAPRLMGAAPAAAPMVADEMAQEAAPMMAKSVADSAVEESAREVMQDTAGAGANYLAQEVPTRAQEAVSNAPDIALWFFIGAVAGVAVYILVNWIIKKIRSRK